MFGAEKEWKEYLNRIKNAKTKIDTKAPRIAARNLLPFEGMQTDANTLKARVRETCSLINDLFCIWHTLGIVDTFPKKPEFGFDNWYLNTTKRLSEIDKANQKIGARLACVKAEVDSGLRDLRLQRKLESSKKKPKEFKYPAEIMKKYGKLELPEQNMQRKFFRPFVYLDIEVKAVNSKGRFVIELYTEACPDVVLEFVKVAVHKDTKRLEPTFLFPDLWMECELAIKDRNSKLFHPLEYDVRCIDHSSGMGVLSFSNEYLNGFKNGVLVFDISLSPLYTVNGKRVGFGRVVRGLKLLSTLGDYGNKNGKMIKEVSIRSCGFLD